MWNGLKTIENWRADGTIDFLIKYVMVVVVIFSVMELSKHEVIF